MPICLFCHENFTPIKTNQKFCNEKHRNAYWNYEKTHAMKVPECFREMLQELADAQNRTLQEMVAVVIANGLNWQERGLPLTTEQIYGVPEKK